MTAQIVTTDLVTINTADPGTLLSWSALGGGASGLAEETDYFIQGSTCISKQVKLETKGQHADFGSSITFPAGAHVYTWLNATTPGAADLRQNGGLRVTMGDSATARKEFYVNGRDTYTYGGWICYPVQYSQTADNAIGSASATPRFFGGVMSNTATVKGINFGVDCIRYGTGIDVTAGTAPDAAITFKSIATVDATTANSWGILQPTASGVALQGRLRIGTDNTTTVTRFIDTDAVLNKPNNNPSGLQQKTSTTFSGIYIRGSQTTATFTGCLFLGLDTIDKGFFDSNTATNKPILTLSGCTFVGWGTTNINASASVSSTSWKNSGSLTLNGATITNCVFQNSSPVIAGSTLSGVQSCSFTRGTAGHAIQTSATGSTSLVGCSFSGYGTTGTSTAAINFTATSGSVTVSISGGTTPTYLSAGVAVTFVTSSTLTLTNLKLNSEVRIYVAGTTTEIAGTELTSSSTFAAAIGVSAVDIVIFNLNYIAIRLTNVLTSADREIPIQQVQDRQYDNPPP